MSEPPARDMGSFVSSRISFRPCSVRSLSAHQECSISTRRLQRPPCIPGVEGGSVWRSMHAAATAADALVEMTSSLTGGRVTRTASKSAAWLSVEGGFPSGCGHRCWAPGLVSRSSPPHVQRGCCAQSSWPRLLSWASPSLSAVRPVSLRFVPSGVAVGFWLPIIPDFPAVAVGLGPVGSGTSSDAGDCLLSPTPRQPGGRLLMSSTLPAPTLVLARNRFAMSKNSVGVWRGVSPATPRIEHSIENQSNRCTSLMR